MTVYIPAEETGQKFLIRKSASIFTNRNGKQDIVIKRRNDAEQGAHGSRESDGKLYNIIAIIAAESGEFLRRYEPIPAEVARAYNDILEQE